MFYNHCRYFLLVVAVYAHTKNEKYLVCANVSERIIVRVSEWILFDSTPLDFQLKDTLCFTDRHYQNLSSCIIKFSSKQVMRIKNLIIN